MPEVKAKGLESKLKTKIANLEVQSVPKHADAEVTLLALFMTTRLCPPASVLLLSTQPLAVPPNGQNPKNIPTKLEHLPPTHHFSIHLKLNSIIM